MEHEGYLQKLMQYIYFFFLSAFVGFLWEGTLTLLRDNELCKRGFFYGPWLPVYGVGGVLFYLLLHRLKKHHVLCFFLSAAIGTALELVIGLLIRQVYHLNYWDYSGFNFNYLGLICLLSSIGFGLAGVFWVGYFSRYALLWWNKLPIKKQKALLLLLLLLFTIDCIIAVPAPHTGRGVTF